MTKPTNSTLKELARTLEEIAREDQELAHRNTRQRHLGEINAKLEAAGLDLDELIELIEARKNREF